MTGRSRQLRRDAPDGGAEDLPQLHDDEIVRYSRHVLIPEVGIEGQRKLKASRVLLVGAGGLGSPAALYLAAAGVGHLGLIDDDVVDESNLQRQILHGTSDIGRRKLDSAADRLHDVNPHVHVERYETRLTSANAMEIIDGYDVLLDGSDNFPTRYLTNDACVLLGIPNIYGSIFRFEGQVSVFAMADGPCYRCLFRDPPPPGLIPTCAEAGVIGVLPGLIGIIQATETLKLLLSLGDSLAGRLLLVDTLRMRFRELRVPRDPQCPACGTREIQELIDYEEFCGLRKAAADSADADIDPEELATRLRNGERLTVIDVREPHEWDIAHIEGATLVPLGSLPEALDDVPLDGTVVVYCKSGGRGSRAVSIMREAGIPNVRNLQGGISRWASEQDPGMRRY